MISLNTFLTLRIHNVCPINLSNLNLEECLDKLDQISYPDREIIQLLSILFVNRNLKRKKSYLKMICFYTTKMAAL